MRLLLDTHILIWTLTDPARLPARALTIVAEAKNTILFSAASIWEIAIKARLGRTDFPMRPERIAQAARDTGFTDCPGTALYNLLNSSAVLSYNQTFVPNGSWLQPLLVLTPRFVKFTAQFDF